jgi:hypothetical protein
MSSGFGGWLGGQRVPHPMQKCEGNTACLGGSLAYDYPGE